MGGGREVGARPSPSWEHKITISVSFSPSYGPGPFSPYEGPLFSFWGGIVSPFALFWGYFLHVKDYFSSYVDSFSGMSSLTKIATSAHDLAAIE